MLQKACLTKDELTVSKMLKQISKERDISGGSVYAHIFHAIQRIQENDLADGQEFKKGEAKAG